MTEVLFITASPKKEGSASSFYLRFLKVFSGNSHSKTLPLRGKVDYDAVLQELDSHDTLVISAPLYFDSIPSHLLAFLNVAEQYILSHQLSLRLYVLSNSGYPEGKQSQTHFEQYRCFCERANITWGGGLSIGGGIMLRAMCYTIAAQLAIFLIKRMRTKTDKSVTMKDFVMDCGINVLITFGMFAGLFRLATAIRLGKQVSNIYTGPLLASFLYIPAASIFMMLSALLHFTMPWKLKKKIHIHRD